AFVISIRRSLSSENGWLAPGFRASENDCHVSSGRLTTIGVGVLLTTTHRNGRELDGLISIWSKNAGTWMKSPASALAANSPFKPHRTSHTPDKTYAIVCCTP